jgi:hypothetical protein
MLERATTYVCAPYVEPDYAALVTLNSHRIDAQRHVSRNSSHMEKRTVWLWRVRKPGKRGWRELKWRMTERDAKSWGKQDVYAVERVVGPQKCGDPS